MVESQEASSAPEQKESKPDRDEYFEEAGRFVIESERAAAGQLQRRFSIGFNRAGRIYYLLLHNSALFLLFRFQ